MRSPCSKTHGDFHTLCDVTVAPPIILGLQVQWIDDSNPGKLQKRRNFFIFYSVSHTAEVMNILITGHTGRGYVLYRLLHLCIDVYNRDLAVV